MNSEIDLEIGNKCKPLNEIATFLDETVSKVALSFMLLQSVRTSTTNNRTM